MNTLRIGTRGSALALAQTNYVMSLLKRCYEDIDIKVKIIKTTGDMRIDKSLDDLGGKRVFIKEIEEALLKDEIDIAVHSMKDVPIELPNGLVIASVPEREDARDAFICKETDGWLNLPAGSIIGTSSIRRASQILALRPDWIIKPLRGNIDTRWKKFEHGEYDAIILAMAGLKRLGLLSEFIHPLDVKEFVPAIGQGALCIETKSERYEIRELVSAVNNIDCYRSVYAERQFLKKIGGDCHSCIGAYAEITNNRIFMIGLVSSSDGKNFLKESIIYDDVSLYEQIGSHLADRLIKKGANLLI